MVRFIVSRKWTILFIFIIVPLGFYTKFYIGPASAWVTNSLGGIFYVVFWSLLFYLAVPQVKPLINALVVFLLTCLIEFLQLWHSDFLELIRSYFIGRTILGTFFSWLDFFYYFLGFIFSILFLKSLNRVENKDG